MSLETILLHLMPKGPFGISRVNKDWKNVVSYWVCLDAIPNTQIQIISIMGKCFKIKFPLYQFFSFICWPTLHSSLPMSCCSRVISDGHWLSVSTQTPECNPTTKKTQLKSQTSSFPSQMEYRKNILVGYYSSSAPCPLYFTKEHYYIFSDIFLKTTNIE